MFVTITVAVAYVMNFQGLAWVLLGQRIYSKCSLSDLGLYNREGYEQAEGWAVSVHPMKTYARAES